MQWQRKFFGTASKISRLLFLTGLAIAVFLAASFLKFTTIVTGYESNASSGTLSNADGIVVLTGGKARLEAGLHLLKNRQAKRLLISGVNPDTSNNAIAQRFKQHEQFFSCCVDYDRLAENTFQNAREAAIWASRQNYSSLIVVTSDYHMPRAILEFSQAMPDIVLKPFAVANIPELYNAKLVSTEQLRILLKEYVKTMVVSLRRITYLD